MITTEPLNCPNCHSENMEMNELYADYNYICRTMECAICNCIWDEIFHFTEYNITQKGEKP